MMALTEEDLIKNVERLYKAMKEHGLVINWNKSNTMLFSKEHMKCKVEVEDNYSKQGR